ncbi:MAG: CAP domain-containing protein [Patescibacteria group bacterium]
MKLFQLLYHFIVPHSGNNHRSKALHHDALFAYALIFMVFNLGIRVMHGTMPDVLGYATDIRVEQLLADTNAKRQAAGLSTLSLNGNLSQAAAAKAADMFANNYWAHNSPNGKTPWDFIIGSGYKYTLAGENLAKNFQTSGGVMEAWMNSPTHRENIVKSGYREVGFAVINGVLQGEETTLVVQMFGTSNGQSTIPKVQAAAPVTKPVELIAEAIPLVAPVFTAVYKAPLINIASVSREVVFIFVGLLMGIMAIDAYVVSKKGIVRLAGHNVAHIVFLATMLIGSLFMIRGTLV